MVFACPEDHQLSLVVVVQTLNFVETPGRRNVHRSGIGRAKIVFGDFPSADIRFAGAWPYKTLLRRGMRRKTNSLARNVAINDRILATANRRIAGPCHGCSISVIAMSTGGWKT